MMERVSLDHLGLVARDITAASEAFTRLGFQLTPLSRHWGPVPPEETDRPWGTGNRCAMMAGGYLEIMGIVDPTLFTNRIAHVLDRREGCYILAFRSGDIDGTRARLVDSGFLPEPKRALARPLDDEGTQRVAFQLVRMTAEDAPEGRAVFVKHETPDLMWRDELLTHPNGAIALIALCLCVEDAAEAAARYARLLDVSRPKVIDGTATLELGAQRIEILTPEVAADRFPGLDRSQVPYAFGFMVAVEDLQATGAVLESNGVKGLKETGMIVVPPPQAAGTYCMFTQAVRSRDPIAPRAAAPA